MRRLFVCACEFDNIMHIESLAYFERGFDCRICGAYEAYPNGLQGSRIGLTSYLRRRGPTEAGVRGERL